MNRNPAQEVNLKSAAAVERAAVDMRREIIESAHAGVIAYLMAQNEEADELESLGRETMAASGQFVILEHGIFPATEYEDPVPSLCLLLKPDENLGQQRAGEEQMRVHVPVPRGTSLDEFFDPGLIGSPDRIVIERTDPFGSIRCYRISLEEVEEFENAFYTGEQVRGEELIARKALEWASVRVNPVASIVGEMLTDLTNWTAEKQFATSLSSNQEVA